MLGIQRVPISGVRACTLAVTNRRENSAEHSWHLALTVLAEDAAEPIDIGHALELATIHDLLEVHAGDSPVYDAIASQDQAERGKAAADRSFALLARGEDQALRRMWEEFEVASSA